MSYLKIRNWQKWQSYRGDRGQPPWIKVHRRIMRDPAWVELTDAQRGQLVAMWLLAADRDGVIPASPATIRKLCYMDSEPNLQVFVEKGFIEADASLASTWRQSDAPEAETEAETEAEAEKEAPASAVAYAAGFQGKVVRLNAKDFASWQSAYHRLDLVAELTARDEYLAEQPPDVRRRWFQSTSKYLANRNMEARAKGEIATAPRLSRTQQATVEILEEIRNGSFGSGICDENSEPVVLEFPKSGSRCKDIPKAISDCSNGPDQISLEGSSRSADGLLIEGAILDDSWRE